MGRDAVVLALTRDDACGGVFGFPHVMALYNSTYARMYMYISHGIHTHGYACASVGHTYVGTCVHAQVIYFLEFSDGSDGDGRLAQAQGSVRERPYPPQH